MSNQIQTQTKNLFVQALFLEVARKNGMGIRRIDGPEKNWRYEPYIPGMIIPVEAEKRRELILKTCRVQGWIIGHEITKAPAKPKLPEIHIPWKKVSVVVGTTAAVAALSTTAVVGVAVIVVTAVAGLVASALPLVALGTLAFIDPSLIVVLEDGSTYEVARWEDRSSLI